MLCPVGHQMPQDLTEHGTQSSVTLQVPQAHCHATLEQSMLGMAVSSSSGSCPLLSQNTHGKDIPHVYYLHLRIPGLHGSEGCFYQYTHTTKGT